MCGWLAQHRLGWHSTVAFRQKFPLSRQASSLNLSLSLTHTHTLAQLVLWVCVKGRYCEVLVPDGQEVWVINTHAHIVWWISSLLTCLPLHVPERTVRTVSTRILICLHVLSYRIIHLFSRLLCKVVNFMNYSASSPRWICNTTSTLPSCCTFPSSIQSVCSLLTTCHITRINRWQLDGIVKACKQLLIDFVISEPFFLTLPILFSPGDAC